VRAVSVHADVIVVTSAVLQANCVVVRSAWGERAPGSGHTEAATGSQPAAETFVIDSPILPDELDVLPGLLEQAEYPAPSGLLATHGDWDHLLGRLAFPASALGCSESTARRLRSSPGEAQRELRAFDEELMIARPRPLALGSVQALPVPGHCAVAARELELHATSGHTADGMAVLIPWAHVLVAGDYLSAAEIPTLGAAGGDLDSYLATLEHLRELVSRVDHVVPGHGPVLDRARALATLDEDASYLSSVRDRGMDAELPEGRRTRTQRSLHAANVLERGPRPRPSDSSQKRR
jgi:glyoxylase-like metal-dependent hydrolase (beta-lactamase superfamily II)